MVLLPEPHSGVGRKHGTSSADPFDRWFRYPAGFASDYAAILLNQLHLKQDDLLIDCFAGSGVAGTACRGTCGFFGIEAHPLIAELAALKLRETPGDPAGLIVNAERLVKAAKRHAAPLGVRATRATPSLILRSFEPEVLEALCALRSQVQQTSSMWGRHLKWALLATLRDVATVRVGWPYQLPGSARQPRFRDPYKRFVARATQMSEDLSDLEDLDDDVGGTVIRGDARDPKSWGPIGRSKAAACISSPPYLNNFDYADATRLETYFWGQANSWAELTSKVRRHMLVASTQQSSKPNKAVALANLARFPEVHGTVEVIAKELLKERRARGRGKEYDQLVPEYFSGMASVLGQLSKAMKSGGTAVWLVGDSAPYGVYIDTPHLIGALAETCDFTVTQDVVLRARGQRWNLTGRHGLELTERLLVFERRPLGPARR
jgi:hypothetical protein